MKKILGVLAAVLLWSVESSAGTFQECAKKDLLGYAPSAEEIDVHRLFQPPVIKYPFGERVVSFDRGLKLTLRIDEAGDAVCYSVLDEFGKRQAINAQREVLLSDARRWRYAPFLANGRPIATIVTEVIREQEEPKTLIPLPQMPLNQVHLSLKRTGCFGSCPSYEVDLYGDGRALYSGAGYVDVLGEHRYSIPPEVIAKLVQSAKDKNLWSLRSSYRAPITDNPTNIVTMQFGTQTHVIEDYVGEMVGMPEAVAKFESEIDNAADSEGWVSLSSAALQRLKAEGFAAKSQAAGELLHRAAANDASHDDRAMVELVEAGAPLDVHIDDKANERGEKSLLDLALENGHEKLAGILIRRGALLTNGSFDRQKLDKAFRSAIAGGKLSAVQAIWDASANHPALTFADHDSESKGQGKTSPVTLLLRPPYGDRGTKAWQGREITKWLAEKGCDLTAHSENGQTLLHIAAESEDVELVHFLLDHGIDPSTPEQFGLPALGSTHSQEVAMALLEAGSRTSSPGDTTGSFREFAEGNHWGQVVAWLDSHPKQR